MDEGPLQINVTLPEAIPPLDRGERYEDPLFDALEEAGLGGRGDGAGSLCSKEGEIQEVDFDVELASIEVIPEVIRLLESFGAPKGSRLRFEVHGKAREVPFGVAEAVVVYLDGIGQPEEVYETTNVDELLFRLLAAIGDPAAFRSSWKGPRETALYFYGSNAQRLFDTIEPVLRGYPLSRTARVVIGHGSAAREVRLTS